MSYMLLAAIMAAIGVLPLLLRRQFVTSTVIGIIGFVVLWIILYVSKVAILPPYLGAPAFLVMGLWCISAGLSMMPREEFGDINFDPAASGIAVVVPVIYIVGLIVTAFVGSTSPNAQAYANLVGQVEEKVWTRDSQPKDPKHVRLLGNETALYIAGKLVGSAGKIGSQYQIDKEHITLQRVHGELVYVVPLDFSGFSQWTATKNQGVPAYLVIDAQDPYLEGKLVKVPEGHGFRYTPGAYFGENLTRYLRQNGFMNVGIADTNFEVDDAGKPWWVIATYERTIVWSGEKVNGVVLVDPSTGAITRYAVDKAPAWIDRIYPDTYVNSYLAYRGSLSGGWWNSWWGKRGLTAPETTSLIYAAGDRAEWVTGITSSGRGNESLVEIAYTDSRTGKTTIYKVDGGATDTAVKTAVENTPYARLNHLTPGTPQMFNIYGQTTAVVSLLSGTNAYFGTALVSVKDPQIIGVGPNIEAAGIDYQDKLFRSGQQALLGNSVSVESLTGTVDRIRQELTGTGNGTYFFTLRGVPRMFSASSSEQSNVKLRLTQPGDTVTVEYVRSGETVVPVRKFDNQSLLLDATPIQQAVAASVAAKKAESDTRSTATDIRKRVEGMSDEELARSFAH